MTEAVTNQVEALRALLDGAPSHRLFERIMALFDEWQAPETLDVALVYAREHMGDWDDTLRHITLDDVWPLFPAGEARPGACLVRSLSLSGKSPFGTEGVSALVASQHFAEITTLSDADVGELDVRVSIALLETGYFKQLYKLGLAEGNIGRAAIETLAASPGLTQITHLDLSANHIGALGLRALSHSPHLQNLTWLDLSFNDIEGEPGLFSDCPSWRQLTHLDLCMNDLGAEDLVCLFGCEHLSNLTHLDLGGQLSLVEPEVILSLLESPHMMSLASMDLPGLNDSTLKGLALLPPRPALTSLRLGHFARGEEKTRMLASAPAFSCVEELYIEKGEWRAESFFALFSPSSLPKLTDLDLGSCLIGLDAVLELAASPRLARVRKLFLDCGHMGPEGAVGLFNSPYLAQLEELRCESLCVDGAQALANSPHLLNLRQLILGSISNVGVVKALAQSRHLTSLSHLCLIPGSDGSLSELAKTTHLPALRRLTIQGHDGLTLVGLVALVKSALFQRLQTIQCLSPVWERANHLPSQAAECLSVLSPYFGFHDALELSALCDLLQMPHVQYLSRFSYAGRVGVEEAEALASSNSFSALEAFGLCGGGIDELALPVLLQAPWLAQVSKELNLIESELGDGGAEILAQTSQLANLQCLDLTRNGIGLAGVRALASSPYLAQLKHLYLDHNAMGDAGLQALVESPTLANLEVLGISGTEVGDEGLSTLARSPHSRRLRCLRLAGNNFGDEGIIAFAESPHIRSLDTLALGRYIPGIEAARALANSPILRHVLTLEFQAIDDTTHDEINALFAFSDVLHVGLRNQFLGYLSLPRLRREAKARGFSRVDKLTEEELRWALRCSFS